MEMPNGNAKWKSQMEMPNGNAEWKSLMEIFNGTAKWKSQMEMSNGNAKWKSQMEIPNGNPICVSLCLSVSLSSSYTAPCVWSMRGSPADRVEDFR